MHYYTLGEYCSINIWLPRYHGHIFGAPKMYWPIKIRIITQHRYEIPTNNRKKKIENPSSNLIQSHGKFYISQILNFC